MLFIVVSFQVQVLNDRVASVEEVSTPSFTETVSRLPRRQSNFFPAFRPFAREEKLTGAMLDYSRLFYWTSVTRDQVERYHLSGEGLT